MRLLMQMRKRDRNSRKIFRRKNGIGEVERIELQRDITK